MPLMSRDGIRNFLVSQQVIAVVLLTLTFYYRWMQRPKQKLRCTVALPADTPRALVGRCTCIRGRGRSPISQGHRLVAHLDVKKARHAAGTGIGDAPSGRRATARSGEAIAQTRAQGGELHESAEERTEHDDCAEDDSREGLARDVQAIVAAAHQPGGDVSEDGIADVRIRVGGRSCDREVSVLVRVRRRMAHVWPRCDCPLYGPD